MKPDQVFPAGDPDAGGTQAVTSCGSFQTALPAPDLEAGTCVGHYCLQSPLGRGGFGMVWLALDLRLERPVALKFLASRYARDPAARHLLEEEARAVAAINHPGVVTLHALEEAEDRLFLVMEHIEGEPLAETLTRGPFALEQALDLSLQMTEALGAAHAHGIIHRDLNPRNVMLQRNGAARILDFGLALRQATRTARGQGSSGGLAGTLPYLSPEQIEEQPLDPRSDLFSLSILIYELLCGQRPFHGDTVSETLRAIQHLEPEIPGHLPENVRSFLRRGLAKRPEQRWPDAASMAQALQDIQQAQQRVEHQARTLAVLPFRDLSETQDEGHFCEGIAEEILVTLARTPSLKVAARTTSFALQDPDQNPQEWGRRLGVSLLITGSVRRVQDHRRIRVALTVTATGEQLWSQRFEAPRTAVFDIQDEIAGALAEALQVRLSPAPTRTRPTHVEAYEDYLRGRQFYYRYNRQSMRFALQMFQQALERQPDYAAAWAGLAQAAAFLYLYADRSEAHRDLALNAAEKALLLEPELAEAHVSRGVAASALGDLERAESCFQRGKALDPQSYDAAYLYARHCFAVGRQGEALAEFTRAAQLFPEDCQAPLLVAQVYSSLGRPQEAEAARRRGLAAAEAHLRRHPEDSRARYLGANALVALGEREKGLSWARAARALDPEDAMLLYNLGCIHALASDPDTALDCLEQSVVAGLTQKGWFLNDGDLSSVREHPRFQAILSALD